MATTFRKVTAYSGFDENLPTGGQGIVVAIRNLLLCANDQEPLKAIAAQPVQLALDTEEILQPGNAVVAAGPWLRSTKNAVFPQP